MWIYEKRLLFPVCIKKTNVRMAKLALSLYGGASGELSAAIGYLNQRYSMPDNTVKAILTDIGTEELAHWEMLGSMIMQCLHGASVRELKENGMDGFYAEHSNNPFAADAMGNYWSSQYISATGDPIADLTSDMAAEQRARAGYEGVLKQCDDPDIIKPLQFLREREIVHYQRFGEALNIVQDKLNKKRCY